jgi:hypothetical protein
MMNVRAASEQLLSLMHAATSRLVRTCSSAQFPKWIIDRSKTILAPVPKGIARPSLLVMITCDGHHDNVSTTMRNEEYSCHP